MRRYVMALCLATVSMLTATTAAGCAGSLMDVMGMLCPECYANYQSTQGD